MEKLISKNIKNKTGNCEYTMYAPLAQFYLKKKPKNVTPQEWLCYIVNEEFGLMQKCIKVKY